ncbi:MAG: hydantoinase/oxoprolinase family protein [Thermoleophilia bacterium]
MQERSGWLVGVDVGGTFTDVLLAPLDGSRTVLAKVPTRVDPAEGVVDGVREAVRRAGIEPAALDLVLHGTTIATNTVVQASGARVGLLVTRGFRYVLEIARSWTPGPISGWMVWDRPAALADVRDTRELSGRISAAGELLEPLDEAEVREAVRALVSRGVEALAVSLVNGYARPDVEAEVAALARDEAPGLPVTCASEVLPEFREYERTLAGVANAYVQPAMRRYVDELQARLADEFPRATLTIVRSDGGLSSGPEAGARPIETVFSGPAGGVRAAVFLGELTGRRDVLSFDMGGTSTDVALSRGGHAPVSRTSALTDYFRRPRPLARRDRDRRGRRLDRAHPADRRAARGPGERGCQPRSGLLRPGRRARDGDGRERRTRQPAEPPRRRDGPAPGPRRARGRRDRRTPRLDGRGRGERDRGDRERQDARRPAARLGQARARPRDFALVAFGGAGPLHANALLEILGSPACLVPPQPGVFSTFGFLVADVRRELARSCIRRLSRLDLDELRAMLAELESRARAWLAAEGSGRASRRSPGSSACATGGRASELPVTHADPAADPGLLEMLGARFVEAHRHAYGFDLDVEPELVVVRCVATGLKPRPEVRRRPRASGPATAAVTDGAHRIWWRGERVERHATRATCSGPATCSTARA